MLWFQIVKNCRLGGPGGGERSQPIVIINMTKSKGTVTGQQSEAKVRTRRMPIMARKKRKVQKSEKVIVA